MQDLSLFRGDYRDLKTSVGSGNFNYKREQGFRVSLGLGSIRDWQGEQSGIRNFNSYLTAQYTVRWGNPRYERA